MLKHIKLLLGLFIMVLLGCEKDDDITENVTIKGNVFNLCTNKGLGNITIYFITETSKSSSSIQTISDTSGNFAFINVSINNSTKYTYYLYIESKSGIGGGSEIGFDGVKGEIDKNKLNELKIMGVVPRFKNLCFQINPAVHISYPDTVIVSFEQKIFHANVPQAPYKSKRTTTELQDGFATCSFGNYPMGLWHITIDKTKGGVQTITNDSIYIDWGETKTYTFSF